MAATVEKASTYVFAGRLIRNADMLPQNLTLQDHHVNFTIDYVVKVIPRSKETKTARATF